MIVQIPTLFGDDVDAHEYSQTVEILGVRYGFTFKYNERMGRWTLNMTAPDGSEMLTGAVVLLGVNLLNYCPPKLRPRGVLTAAWAGETEQATEAGERDLGDRVKLYHYERASDLDPQPPAEARKA